MVRQADGTLHYIINGEDQGAAAQIPPNVYAVIDLYGQCAQVSIVNQHQHGVTHTSDQGGLQASCSSLTPGLVTNAAAATGGYQNSHHPTAGGGGGTSAYLQPVENNSMASSQVGMDSSHFSLPQYPTGLVASHAETAHKFAAPPSKQVELRNNGTRCTLRGDCDTAAVVFSSQPFGYCTNGSSPPGSTPYSSFILNLEFLLKIQFDFVSSQCGTITAVQ